MRRIRIPRPTRNRHAGEGRSSLIKPVAPGREGCWQCGDRKPLGKNKRRQIDTTVPRPPDTLNFAACRSRNRGDVQRDQSTLRIPALRRPFLALRLNPAAANGRMDGSWAELQAKQLGENQPSRTQAALYGQLERWCCSRPALVVAGSCGPGPHDTDASQL